jgi:hypothetical protein
VAAADRVLRACRGKSWQSADLDQLERACRLATG